jgi:hypothetical protein
MEGHDSPDKWQILGETKNLHRILVAKFLLGTLRRRPIEQDEDASQTACEVGEDEAGSGSCRMTCSVYDIRQFLGSICTTLDNHLKQGVNYMYHLSKQ